MSYWKTPSFHRRANRQEQKANRETGSLLSFGFLDTILGFEHVLDVSLEEQKVGCLKAIYLQRAAVIPLDCALDFFAILQYDNHRRVRIDLLLVVEKFGVGLHRRGRSFAHLLSRTLLRSMTAFTSSVTSSAITARSPVDTSV